MELPMEHPQQEFSNLACTGRTPRHGGTCPVRIHCKKSPLQREPIAKPLQGEPPPIRRLGTWNPRVCSARFPGHQPIWKGEHFRGNPRRKLFSNR